MYWDTDVLRHVLLCLFVFNLCYTSKYCNTGIGLSESLKNRPVWLMILCNSATIEKLTETNRAMS